MCRFLAVLVGFHEPSDILGVGHHLAELLPEMGCSKVHRMVLQLGVGHVQDIVGAILVRVLGDAQLLEAVGQLIELVLRHVEAQASNKIEHCHEMGCLRTTAQASDGGHVTSQAWLPTVADYCYHIELHCLPIYVDFPSKDCSRRC